MTPRTRGLVVFAVMVAVAVVFCGLFPFVIMPGAGLAPSLPVIEVPGEVVVEEFLPDFNLTNTIIGTVLTDIILVLFILLAWRASNGWRKEIPGRFQGFVESFVQAFYNFSQGIAGDRLRTTPGLWPLVATIFFFLLAANWMKLLPGVETVGKMHCAHVGQSGYPMIEGWTDNSYRLYNAEILNAGESQTEEAEHLCEHYFYGEFERYPVESAEEIEAQLLVAEEALPEYEAELAAAQTALAEAGDGLSEDELEELQRAETEALEAYEKAEREVERQLIRLEAAEGLERVEAALESLEEVESGDAITFTVSEVTHEGLTFETLAGLRADVAAAVANAQAAETEEDLETEVSDLKAELGSLEDFYKTQLEWPTATLTFDEDLLDSDAAPWIFHITPFVRGPATDLSLTFALAIMSIVLVQVYGVMALGPAYFDKFLNIPALGNLGKKPLGLIDFVVGLIEIISEIGKIVSLAFRLFGNLFAGGVALMAVTFLVALLVPGIIYGLEIIIGTVQALVFAVLTLVFSVQAMESHHGDEHGEEHH